jgi:hypothetical protein
MKNPLEMEINMTSAGIGKKLLSSKVKKSNRKVIKSKFKEKFLNNSLYLVDTFRLRKIDLYSKITNREGFMTILIVFVCLYSFSFILWTHGVSEKEETSSLNTNLEYIEDANLAKLCNTFDFAKKFMSFYLVIFAFFRFICMTSNILISIVYHFKFRSNVFEKLSNSFKIKEEKELKKLKCLNYKTFQLFYSTEKWQENSSNNVTNEETPDEEAKSKENYKLHLRHLLFVQFYAIFAFIYSFLIFPVVLKELCDAINQFKKYNFNKSSYVTSKINFFNQTETIDQFPSVNEIDSIVFGAKNLTEDKNMTNAFMNSFFQATPEKFKEINFDFLINFTQTTAHFIKLPILFIFMIHIKFFIEFKF